MNMLSKQNTFGSFILFIIILLIFSACPNPSGGDGTESGLPEPPSSVTGSLSGDVINVSWVMAESAKRYQLYRKIGDGAFTALGPLSSVNQYTDTSFPPDILILYAVKSEVDGLYSVISRSSNPVSENVLNISVSRYEFTDGVRLSWGAIEDLLLESYNVYRYLSREEGAAPESVTEVTDNFYYDTTGLSGVPYFYRITWEKEGLEYGFGAPLNFGIRGVESDGYEPNDDYYVLTSEDTTQFFDWNTSDWSRAPFAYSYEDGAGGAESDTDYYKYKGPPATLFVRVELPEDTPFNESDCKLYIQFLHEGDYGESRQVLPDIVNEYVFSDFNFMEETVHLYFRIYPVVSSSRSALGKYKVLISDEFKGNYK